MPRLRTRPDSATVAFDHNHRSDQLVRRFLFPPASPESGRELGTSRQEWRLTATSTIPLSKDRPKFNTPLPYDEVTPAARIRDPSDRGCATTRPCLLLSVTVLTPVQNGNTRPIKNHEEMSEAIRRALAHGELPPSASPPTVSKITDRSEASIQLTVSNAHDRLREMVREQTKLRK